MITYTMGITPEYIRLIVSIWRENGSPCPLVFPEGQKKEDLITIQIGPTSEEKVSMIVDKIWDIAGAKRLVKDIEKQPVCNKNF